MKVNIGKKLQLVVIEKHNKKIEERGFLMDTMISIIILVREWVKQGVIYTIVNN